MGFWSGLGKILLKAAPYVAAPFTGGMSLAAAPLTNQLGAKWSANDDAKRMSQGLGPSSFDKYLNLGGNLAGIAGGLGAFGKLGGNQSWRTPPYVPEQGGGGNWANTLGGMFGGGGGGSQPTSRNLPQTVGLPSANTSGGVMPRGGYRFNESPMNQLDQSSPNLAQSIFQGRQEAMRNQPFRSGYDIITDTGERDEEDKPITTTQRMPRIFSTGTGGRRNTRGEARKAAGY